MITGSAAHVNSLDADVEFELSQQFLRLSGRISRGFHMADNATPYVPGSSRQEVFLCGETIADLLQMIEVHELACLLPEGFLLHCNQARLRFSPFSRSE